MYRIEIATVLTPAASYDLTTLAVVHDELGIATTDTSSDGFLGRAITQVSAVIATSCNRVFAVETVQEIFYRLREGPTRQRLPEDSRLQLARWPVVAIASLTETDPEGNITVLVENTDFILDSARGQLVRLDSTSLMPRPWCAAIVTAQYSGGYLGTAWSEAQTVPGSGPYTVAVANAATFALDKGVVCAATAAPLTAVAGAPTAGQYSVSAGGVYTFAAADTGKGVLITYQYGAIPADLVDACLRLVTGRYKAKDRDPLLMQRDQPNLGTTRYWVGNAPGQNGALSPEIEALVAPYRVPAV